MVEADGNAEDVEIEIMQVAVTRQAADAAQAGDPGVRRAGPASSRGRGPAARCATGPGLADLLPQHGQEGPRTFDLDRRQVGIDLAAQLLQGRLQRVGVAVVQQVQAVVDMVHVAEQRRRRGAVQGAADGAGIAAPARGA